jgi:beta-lactamase regulating signal transducer with metallopeptidase domain
VTLLAAWAWKSTAIVMLAMLAIFAARRRPAADKAAILQLAVAALLLLPFLDIGFHCLGVGIPADMIKNPAALGPTHEAAVPLSPPAAATAIERQFDWLLLIAFLYLAYGGGVILFASRLVLGMRRLRRWTRDASEIPDGRWRQALADNAVALRASSPRILLSGRIEGPLSWGLMRPVILIDAASAARPEDAGAILSHELAHIVRRDWAVLILARVAVALFWFNPFVWLLARKLADETEKAADQIAGRQLGASDYAQTLVSTARRTWRSPVPALTMAPGRRRLSSRVRALLDDDGKAPAGPVARAGAALAGAVALLPLAALGLVANADLRQRVVPAEKLFPYLQLYYSFPAPDRSKVVLDYILTLDGKPATGLGFLLNAGDRSEPLRLDADGKVERLPSAADLAAHAVVMVRAPAGQHNLIVTPSLHTSIPPAREISAADCAQAIAQVTAGSRKIKGLLGFLVSRTRAVTFPGAGVGIAILADGRTVPLPLLHGAPAYDPAVIRSAKLIRLARMPLLVDLE